MFAGHVRVISITSFVFVTVLGSRRRGIEKDNHEDDDDSAGS